MRTRVEMFCQRANGQMKEESNCFGLIIWIWAARGYTHLLRALSGWWDGGEGGTTRGSVTAWYQGGGKKLARIALSLATAFRRSMKILLAGQERKKKKNLSQILSHLEAARSHRRLQLVSTEELSEANYLNHGHLYFSYSFTYPFPLPETLQPIHLLYRPG